MFQPYYLYLKIINFVSTDANIAVKHINGSTVTNILVQPGQENAMIDLSFQLDSFPLFHIVEAFYGTQRISVNGKKEISVIPTSERVEIPLYISFNGMLVFYCWEIIALKFLRRRQDDMTPSSSVC